MKILQLALMICGLACLAMAQSEPIAAPEIDAGSATAAVSVLVAGVMLWRAKLRK